MKDLTYKLLTIEQVEEIEALQQIVVDSLENPTILQPLSRAEFKYILDGNGVMLGAFNDTQLIACRALLKPDPLEAEHLGIDAKAKDLTRVLYQEVSFVHPSFRGNGLQKILGARIMQCINLADFDLVCATVKPFNIASLKDKFSQGMNVVALKLKYGGKLRYVFSKHLHNESNVFEKEKIVNMAATKEQQELLAQGYVGTNIHSEKDQWFITYKK